MCSHWSLTSERAVTCNRSKQTLRPSSAPFKLMVPGICIEASDSRKSPGPGEVLQKGENFLTCAGLAMVSSSAAENTVEKRNAVRCLCTLTPSILSPRFPLLSFLPRENVLCLFFLNCFQPFRLNHSQRRGSGQAHFWEDNRWTLQGPGSHTMMGKTPRTGRIWKRKRGHDH